MVSKEKSNTFQTQTWSPHAKQLQTIYATLRMTPSMHPGKFMYAHIYILYGGTPSAPLRPARALASCIFLASAGVMGLPPVIASLPVTLASLSIAASSSSSVGRINLGGRFPPRPCPLPGPVPMPPLVSLEGGGGTYFGGCAWWW